MCVNPIIVPNQAYWWIRLLWFLQIKMWKVFRQVDQHNGLIYVMGVDLVVKEDRERLEFGKE